jgi:carbamoyl-phosphate synthase large subunit
MADKLYFEPIYWEHLIELIEFEKPEGVIVQLGGQTALKLSEKFHEKEMMVKYILRLLKTKMAPIN